MEPSGKMSASLYSVRFVATLKSLIVLLGVTLALVAVKELNLNYHNPQDPPTTLY